jgi:hypothetical protein
LVHKVIVEKRNKMPNAFGTGPEYLDQAIYFTTIFS